MTQEQEQAGLTESDIQLLRELKYKDELQEEEIILEV